MFTTQVVLPELVPSDSICCDDCDLKYSKEDYDVLHSSNKLAYFFVPKEEQPKDEADMNFDLVFCHDCLFKHLKFVSGGDEMSILILDGEKEHSCTFSPLDFDDPEGDRDLEDFYPFDLDDEDENGDDEEGDNSKYL